MEMIDPSIISEFTSWKKVNEDSFTWWSYVNMKSDIQLALGFANFFCPDLLLKEDCVLLKDHFDEEVYFDWKKELNGNKTEIEKIMNFYEVRDFFHIHSDENDPFYEEQVKSLAKAIQFFWSLSFNYYFPDKKIVVTVFEEYNTTCITVYEEIEM